MWAAARQFTSRATVPGSRTVPWARARGPDSVRQPTGLSDEVVERRAVGALQELDDLRKFGSLRGVLAAAQRACASGAGGSGLSTAFSIVGTFE